MAKAFECEVCGVLVAGEPTTIKKEIHYTNDQRIEFRAVMYGIAISLWEDDETTWDPDVCEDCQIQAMRDLIRDYEKED